MAKRTLSDTTLTHLTMLMPGFMIITPLEPAAIMVPSTAIDPSALRTSMSMTSSPYTPSAISLITPAPSA